MKSDELAPLYEIPKPLIGFCVLELLPLDDTFSYARVEKRA